MNFTELDNGKRVNIAEYQEQDDILEYRGNPLIEALPPVFSQEEVINSISVYPPYSDEEKYLPAYKRVHLLSRLQNYFQPTPIHLNIESSISRLIRKGYTFRNPIEKTYAQGFADNWDRAASQSTVTSGNSIIPTGQTLSIVGISGVGKTRTIQRILNTVPQIISHVEYKGRPLNQYQVTYLKIETPFDGSVKTIIYDFMYQVDQLLGTNYFNRYANSRLSTSQLMPIMAQIAKSINLGVLVIDELQHLKGLRKSSSTQVLNFFTALINTISIPLIMVGTPKAMDVLQKQFRQARRNTNVGNVFWNRMKKDEIWDLFLQGMWRYQWVRTSIHLDEELSAAFYRYSQGIADIAVKLFMMVQLRAISSGQETITSQLVKQVAQEELKMVQPMLQALEKKDYSRLVAYEDLILPELESFLQKEQNVINQKEVMSCLRHGIEKRDMQSEKLEDAVARLCLLGFDQMDVTKAVNRTIDGSSEKSLNNIVQEAFQILVNPEEKNVGVVDEKDLRYVIKKGKEENKSAYYSLVNAGVIKQDYSVGEAL